MHSLRAIFGSKFLIILFVFTLSLISEASYAKASSKDSAFVGFWRGSGMMKINGKSKRTRCRVRNTKKAGKQYYSTISCTVSGLGSGMMTIVVNKVGASSYAGGFKNKYTQDRVRLSARQTGRKIRVRVSGKKISGVITLRKS